MIRWIMILLMMASAAIALPNGDFETAGAYPGDVPGWTCDYGGATGTDFIVTNGVLMAWTHGTSENRIVSQGSLPAGLWQISFFARQQSGSAITISAGIGDAVAGLWHLTDDWSTYTGEVRTYDDGALWLGVASARASQCCWIDSVGVVSEPPAYLFVFFALFATLYRAARLSTLER
jgi:hypothetical protein